MPAMGVVKLFIIFYVELVCANDILSIELHVPEEQV